MRWSEMSMMAVALVVPAIAMAFFAFAVLQPRSTAWRTAAIVPALPITIAATGIWLGVFRDPTSPVPRFLGSWGSSVPRFVCTVGLSLVVFWRCGRSRSRSEELAHASRGQARGFHPSRT